MAPQCRNRYNEEFKKRAVCRHLESRGTLAESAAKSGITPGMLSKWIVLYSRPKESVAVNCEEEVRYLREQVRVLKEIVGKAFLKKYSVDEMVEKMIDEPEKFLAVGEIPAKKIN